MEFENIIEADRSVVFDVFLSTNRALFREKALCQLCRQLQIPVQLILRDVSIVGNANSITLLINLC